MNSRQAMTFALYGRRYSMGLYDETPGWVLVDGADPPVLVSNTEMAIAYGSRANAAFHGTRDPFGG